jgi:hypothetical protein
VFHALGGVSESCYDLTARPDVVGEPNVVQNLKVSSQIHGMWDLLVSILTVCVTAAIPHVTPHAPIDGQRWEGDEVAGECDGSVGEEEVDGNLNVWGKGEKSGPG